MRVERSDARGRHHRRTIQAHDTARVRTVRRPHASNRARQRRPRQPRRHRRRRRSPRKGQAPTGATREGRPGHGRRARRADGHGSPAATAVQQVFLRRRTRGRPGDARARGTPTSKRDPRRRSRSAKVQRRGADDRRARRRRGAAAGTTAPARLLRAPHRRDRAGARGDSAESTRRGQKQVRPFSAHAEPGQAGGHHASHRHLAAHEGRADVRGPERGAGGDVQVRQGGGDARDVGAGGG